MVTQGITSMWLESMVIWHKLNFSKIRLKKESDTFNNLTILERLY